MCEENSFKAAQHIPCFQKTEIMRKKHENKVLAALLTSHTEEHSFSLCVYIYGKD